MYGKHEHGIRNRARENAHHCLVLSMAEEGQPSTPGCAFQALLPAPELAQPMSPLALPPQAAAYSAGHTRVGGQRKGCGWILSQRDLRCPSRERSQHLQPQCRSDPKLDTR